MFALAGNDGKSTTMMQAARFIVDRSIAGEQAR